MSNGEVKGLLLDLDGTVYHGGRAVPGAREAIGRLRERGVPFRFATNTTRRPRAALAARLRTMGIDVADEEVLTAPRATARWLRARGARTLSLLLDEATHVDFGGFELDHDRPDHVVVGDLGDRWSYPILDRAFRALTAGAELVAIQKNRYWDDGDGLHIDAGPFVAALEHASGKVATLIGKPAAPFFLAAADELGLAPERIAVVGDSVQTDVAGGQAAGCLGVLVQTGSYREDLVLSSGVRADVVLPSIAELPRWLGL